ncbi:hypothetical protein J4573_02210 [Actinomadura barringtoniae]|uniref:Uncharacterized protein n=1 Tax=Actinomadura barringtoniae TaxID=1427535 RepID=A0A939P6L9_9ACTN|nr:hypothetical protein [Actinomadura barringtoniae]MBO2445892.1 hypothetical protein [Actinomadura barringtoniae]
MWIKKVAPSSSATQRGYDQQLAASWRNPGGSIRHPGEDLAEPSMGIPGGDGEVLMLAGRDERVDPGRDPEWLVEQRYRAVLEVLDGRR